MNKKKWLMTMMSFLLILVCHPLSIYAKDEWSIDADAALIVEVNSGKILYEKNAEEKHYPASITKIITAIVVLENSELEDVAIVSQNAIDNVPEDYVKTPLVVGEQVKIEDLLYALLLKSSSDAAYVLAEHVGGTVEEFCEMMNQKAKEIGCQSTHFINPNGMHDENHYTTAYDLFFIAQYAMENEVFAKIVSTAYYTLPGTEQYPNDDRIMENTNYFVVLESKYYDQDVKGVKTGTTTEAGNCLITNVEKNGFRLFTVVLGAKTKESRYTETQHMIQYVLNNYTHTMVHQKGDVIQTVMVENATKKTKELRLQVSDDIEIMHRVDCPTEELQPKIMIVENVKAPISKGQALGTIQYVVDGIPHSATLLAENDVLRKTYDIEVSIGCGLLLLTGITLWIKGGKGE